MTVRTNKEFLKRLRLGLIRTSVKNELAKGTKHYNGKGELLKTIDEIMKELEADREITFTPTEDRKEEFEKSIGDQNGNANNDNADNTPKSSEPTYRLSKPPGSNT